MQHHEFCHVFDITKGLRQMVKKANNLIACGLTLEKGLLTNEFMSWKRIKF